MRPAVVIVDMLDDFVTGALANPNAESIIPQIAELASTARERGWPVVYSNDAHLPGDAEERIWGPHALAGTPGAEVIGELAPQPGDLVLPKRFYSAFYETGLDAYLRQDGVDTVVLCGQHTHICVRHSAADALYRGYHIVVPCDAVAHFGGEDQEAGLRYLKDVYGAALTPTAEVIGAVPAAR